VFLATDPEVRIRFPALPDFLRSSGSGRGPLNLVSTTEELLERKSSGSGLENREYDRRNPSRCPRGTLYPQKLALTSPTSGGRSVGIVRSRTQTTEFRFSGRRTKYHPTCTRCVVPWSMGHPVLVRRRSPGPLESGPSPCYETD
jgi:hypothetical protein